MKSHSCSYYILKQLASFVTMVLVCHFNSVSQPLVSLGNDTLVCGGSLVLDAGNPGASFLWSTGATTQTIIATTTDSYWVDVTDGVGTTRDSINLIIASVPPSPSINDTTICGPGTVQYVLGGSGDFLLISESGTGIPVALGAQPSVYIAGTQSFEAEIGYYNFPAQTGFESVSNGNYFSVSNQRGLNFDVTEPILFESVNIAIDGPISAILTLLNSNGDTLIQSPFSAGTAGLHKVQLGIELLPDQGYSISLSSISGSGKPFIRLSGFTYPIIGNGVTITSGFPTASHYNFFFGLSFRTIASCSSTKDQFTVTLSPLPQVDLGEDTTLCDASGLILNAGPGFTYLWSTGASSQTINVQTSETYFVTVTNGAGCENADSVHINFLNSPTIELDNDTSICGPQQLHFTASGAGYDGILWYNSTSSTPINTGESFSYFFNSSDTVYAEAYQKESSLITGLTSTDAFNYYSVNNTRGIIFDITSPQFFDSVSIGTNGPKNGILTLLSPSNDTLFSSFQSIPSAGFYPIEINIFIQSGIGYRLQFESLSGSGKMAINISDPYPILEENVTLREGFPNTSHYSFFFDWKFSQPSKCYTTSDAIEITVLEIPVIDLGLDTFSCGIAPVTIDAFYPNASYIWNTGDTTSSIAPDSSGNYSVNISLPNNCTFTDKISLLIKEAPQDPVLPADTSRCTPEVVTLSSQTSSDGLFWFDSQTAQNAIFIGEDFQRLIDSTTTYYAETIQYGLNKTTGLKFDGSGSYFSVGNQRGVEFTVKESLIIDTVSMYVSIPHQTKVTILDKHGDIIFQKVYNLLFTNENKLSIATPLWPGTYQLLAEPIGNNELVFININNPFPIIGNELDITKGVPISTHYNYFYNWVIRTPQNCKSNRIPTEQGVEIPVTVPPYIYNCKDTTLSFSIPGASYIWSTGSTLNLEQFDSSGLYSIEILKGNCVLNDTFEIEIPVDAGLPADGVLCGNTLFTRYDSTAIFHWSTGDSSFSIPVFSPDTITVEVLEPQGCILRDTIRIIGFSDFPFVDLGEDTTGCDGVLLSVQTPGLQYKWSNGDTTQTIFVTSSSIVSVVVTNEFNCSSRDSVGVFIPPLPFADFILADTIISADLTVQFINQSSFGSYLWDFGDLSSSTSNSPTHTYDSIGQYCVTLITTDILNGCGNDTTVRCFTLLRYPVNITDEIIQSPQIKVYPNPTSGEITLEIMRNNGPLEANIFDLNGRMVYQQIFTSPQNKIFSINLPIITQGLYVLQVKSSDSTYSQMITLTN